MTEELQILGLASRDNNAWRPPWAWMPDKSPLQKLLTEVGSYRLSRRAPATYLYVDWRLHQWMLQCFTSAIM